MPGVTQVTWNLCKSKVIPSKQAFLICLSLESVLKAPQINWTAKFRDGVLIWMWDSKQRLKNSRIKPASIVVFGESYRERLSLTVARTLVLRMKGTISVREQMKGNDFLEWGGWRELPLNGDAGCEPSLG